MGTKQSFAWKPLPEAGGRNRYAHGAPILITACDDSNPDLAAAARRPSFEPSPRRLLADNGVLVVAAPSDRRVVVMA